VQEQYVIGSALPTYIATADAVAFAASKHLIGLFNGVGSGCVLRLKQVLAVNLQTGGVTGAAYRVNLQRTTAQSAGTAVVPRSMDSADPAIPAQVLCATGATITAGALLIPRVMTTEERQGGASIDVIGAIQDMNNLIPAGPEQKELVLREGEGFSVQQSGGSTVGSFAWSLVFTLDLDT